MMQFFYENADLITRVLIVLGGLCAAVVMASKLSGMGNNDR